MLRPHPPPYVRKPGRKKTKRTREVGEKPTGTKLNKVGVQMQCSLCRKTTHNIRKCPYNKEAGKRKNAHIKRDAAKKRKQSEAATVAEGSSVRKFHIAFLFFLFYQFSENYILILYVRAPKAPRAFAEAPRPAPAARQGQLMLMQKGQLLLKHQGHVMHQLFKHQEQQLQHLLMDHSSKPKRASQGPEGFIICCLVTTTENV